MKLRHHQFLKAIIIFLASRVSMEDISILSKMESQGVFFMLKGYS